MQSAANAVCLEIFFQLSTPWVPHHVHMPDTFRVIRLRGQFERSFCKQLMVSFGNTTPLARPSTQEPKLYSKGRALDPFHSIIEAYFIVIVPAGRAVIA